MDQVTKAVDSGIAKFTEKYELDAEIVAVLRTLLLEAFNGVSLATAEVDTKKTKGKAKAKSSRRKTGYNCYIKAQFAKVRENGTDVGCNSQELMTRFSKEWQTLSEADQKPFNDQAEEINAKACDEASGSELEGAAAPARSRPRARPATEGSSDPKKTKALTGYNIFYRENRETIKRDLAEGEKLMTKVGATWNALSADEKAVYNAKAKETDVVVS